MKILFNAANLTAGGGLFAGAALLQNWILRPQVEIHALLSPQMVQVLGGQTTGCLKSFTTISPSPGSSLPAGRGFRKKATAFEQGIKPNAVFTAFGPPRWRPAAPHLCGFANGLYLPAHKAQPYRGRATPIERGIHLLKRAAVFYSLSRDTNAIWVETEDCKAQLSALVRRAKIAVVPNEVNACFLESSLPAKPNEKTFNLLFPAAGYAHKNFALLRAILQTLPANTAYRFWVTLLAADFKKYFGTAASHPALRNLGALLPAELVPHYQNAHAVFVPSIAEIFSATWLEAFAMKRPLLCANIAASQKVCGKGALYFDGHSVPATLESISTLAGDYSLQQQLVLAGTAQLAHFQKGPSRADALFDLLLQTAQNTKCHA